MAEATVLEYGQVPDPNMEVVQLECSDGETFTCRKLRSIIAVCVSGNEDVDAHINAVFSTANPPVVTVNYASQTDKKVSLIIIGKQ